MTSSLGHHAASQRIINVHNSSTTVTIAANTVVKFDYASGVVTADGMTNDPVINVLRNDIPDTTTGASAIALGISRGEILPGNDGEIVVWGMVKCVIEDTSLSIGDVLGCQSANDQNLHDIATATEQAPCAILLEVTTSTVQTKWVFADFLSAKFGGNAGVDTLNVKFWGIAY